MVGAVRNQRVRTAPPVVTAVPILFQDDEYIVVNKPSGLVVHRGWAREAEVVMTLVRDQIGAWVYPVHRLDRGTSGALVFALSPDAARYLSQQFDPTVTTDLPSVRKHYLALVRGTPPAAGTIDNPVPAGEDKPRVDAITEFVTLGSAQGVSLVRCRPLTGRLHQIRRHLKHISHPLVGDVRYGKGPLNRRFRAEFDLHRLALHAQALAVQHPRRGPIEIEAPLPPDLEAALQALDLLRCSAWPPS